MNYRINDAFCAYESNLNLIIQNYETQGQPYGNQERNSLKTFELNDRVVNVKSFKIPNVFNQIAYSFFRKSKACRSYEYANKLINLEIGTPQPIAYYESKAFFLFKKSFYISEHLDYQLTYRELIDEFDYPDHERILRAFVKFTYELHEKQILFLDHSPGNTLIKKENGTYKFYLVDLNRMKFKALSFEERMKNFDRLSKHKFMVEIMSDEYAKLSGISYDKVYAAMWQNIQSFQEKFYRKKRLKKALKFWKKS
ncbi:MAG: Kdo domain containing protein [Flavobacteriaceae bacterium]|nr:Kdo domain containing protein [Flavobacteriaceae bacterium]